ncbi:unnamed protein product [Didymodactylos carnosus]|uniref:Domain of unknown function with conserved HDNR motif domain-containing protein n=1 Tax=Didymodactylos carnosus TaxID=1234261 RepID=A0A814F5I1_9BILA|nr:unnamed protein product [Didymodactylos carnosus]CAF0975301.1 unnamed protein product [Didymodactylos carnosus]CAF3662956.1 unnamed protein product [Didymodactylos carnosus]CAF3748163.1 unnamed protein product [Didymodactylos carnosus]
MLLATGDHKGRNDEQSQKVRAFTRRHDYHLPKTAKEPGYWFKQRGYTDPSFDRRQATTTGHMLNQVYQSNSFKENTITPFLQDKSNTKKEYSNRCSEHDNRNTIQMYGEYFGQGCGKRLMPNNVFRSRHSFLEHNPEYVRATKSVSHHDYRGLQLPEYLIYCANKNKMNKNKSNNILKEFNVNDNESTPTELLYRNEYRKLPAYPWKYHYRTLSRAYPLVPGVKRNEEDLIN